jgi:hypothetical protein
VAVLPELGGSAAWASGGLCSSSCSCAACSFCGWAGAGGRAAGPASRRLRDTSEWKRLQQPLFARTYQLTGKPDYLVAEGSRLVPVEVKSGRAPEQPYPSHVLQLAAYCLLVEDCYDRRPSRGIIQYTDRAFEVDYTPSSGMFAVHWMRCARSGQQRR